MSTRDVVVEQLYKLYQKRGYVTEDEIFSSCEEYDLSIFDIDYVTNKIFDLGVLVTEKPKPIIENDKSSDTVEVTDFAQSDYSVVYNFFQNNYSGMRQIVEYAKKVTPIQHGEIFQLINQIRSGNKHAKEIIFNKYIRLALKSTYNYRKKTTLPLEDIFQEACLSILKAIDSYDPYKNSAFSSYCSTWIMQGIERYISDHESMIRIPVHEQERIIKAILKFDENHDCADNEVIEFIKRNSQKKLK